MLRVAVVALALASMSGVASAQWGWGSPWDDDRPLRRSPYSYPYPYPYPYRQAPNDSLFWGDERPRNSAPPRSSLRPSFRSGGLRPQIAPLAPARVAFPSTYAVGSVVIDHKGRQLLLVQSRTAALRYPISVGREGFGWSGTERISKVVDWPDWYPPADMRARDRSLPAHMSGGLRNPLGAKALYLGKTLYRIHGTNDVRSIGRAASSGCFRMLNGHVVDLASRIEIGTVVRVVRRLPPELDRIVAAQARGEVVRVSPMVKAPAPRPPRVKAAPVVPEPDVAGPEESAPGEEEPVEDGPVEDGPAGEGLGGRERGA